jgi:hypothetical protein
MALDSLPFVRWITATGAENHKSAPSPMIKIELKGAFVIQDCLGIPSASSSAKFRTHAENYAIPNDQRDCLSKE